MNQITLAIKPFLSWFGLVSALLACLSVATNTLIYSPHDFLLTNCLFLWAGVLLALLPFFETSKNGLMCLIFFLPLAAGIHQQINEIFKLSFSATQSPGLDLIAGFFIAHLTKRFITKPKSLGGFVMPWPLGLLMLYISFSTALAIARNIRQSATETSLYGFVFNLTHFRPIGWHDDYMPISDWIAYGCAGSLIILVIQVLKKVEDKNEAIFRPLLAGLLVASLMGIFQSITGVGLTESMKFFRKDLLGFAAIGFQPDIHAYAGHMLLGAIGLWGYFRISGCRLERILILVTIALSWYGLFISKSRASLSIAIIFTLVAAVISIRQKSPKWFSNLSIIGVIGCLLYFFYIIFNAELPLQAFTHQSFDWWSFIGGASGSRLEIWSGAFNMIKAFPLIGVGQGNFYHLSADIAFSKSHFLALNGGENAHNYFLQTFAELGLVGVSLLGLIFLWPVLRAANKKALIPVAQAILALFLGNVYAHSFLVRENLLLCAVLIGLAYALACNTCRNQIGFLICPERLRAPILLVGIILAGISMNEVYQSFFTKVFDIGVNCYTPKALTRDGWTSGIYEIEIPPGAKGIKISGFRPQTGLHPKDIKLRLDLVGNGDRVVMANSTGTIREGKKTSSIFLFDQPIESNFYGGILILRTQNCFTPRNMGLNIDGRILGVQIDEVKVLY